jgi:tetratricopeptide (TPR) repeat protein
VAAEFLEGRRGFQFDVYQIPFHAGGGGKPEPLPGASANGMSNYFPRPSPDGKWIVFTQARNFMLLQPDSKLAILPAGGGAARRMACNTDSMNSWHSWSPNGRWLAFASKVRGPYTDVCLTHVDSAGQDTPPVVLERFHTPDRAANIPEFVNVKPSAFAVLVDRFSDQPHYYLTVGRNRLGEKKIREAIPYFDKVISADSAFPDAYVFKGHAHFMLGEYRDAVAAYDKAISLGYRDRDTQVNRGSALYNLKDYRAAVRAYSEAIAIDPKHALAFVARGKAIAKTGDLRRAIADFDRAVALGNRSEETFTERGLCRALLDEYAPALEDFRAALKIRPENAETRKMAGKALFQLGRFKEAADAYTEAIRFAGNDREAYSSRAACRSRTNDLRGAIDDYDQALRIDPSSAVDMYRRGRIKINIGDRAAGCADLARAQALGFPDASVELRRYCGS